MVSYVVNTERGVRVPQDLDVVSVDGTKEAEFSWPPLTVVAEPIGQQARFHGALVARRCCGCPAA